MDSNEAINPDCHQRKPLVLVLRIALVLLALFVLATIVGAIFISKSHEEKKRLRVEVQKRLEALRSAGKPLTAVDLSKRFPDPPREKDASNILEQSFAALTIPEEPPENLPLFGEAGLPPRTKRFSPEVKREVEEFLKANRAAIDAVPQEELSNAWFGLSFTNGLTNFVSAPLKKLRQLALVVSLDALMKAEAGNGEKAARSLRQCLLLGHTLRSDIMINHLSKRNIERLYCQTIEQTLNLVELSSGELNSLATMMTNASPFDWEVIFETDRCVYVSVFEVIRTNVETEVEFARSPLSRLLTAWRMGRIYSDLDYLKFLDCNAQMAEAIRLPANQGMARMAEIEASYKQRGKKQRMASYLYGAAFSGTFRREQETLARLLVTHTGVEVERWRLLHDGKLPESLNELIPGFLSTVPIDRFDEKPLRYKKLSQGYVVYSIGSDFEDNGGKDPQPTPKDSDKYDITFTVDRK